MYAYHVYGLIVCFTSDTQIRKHYIDGNFIGYFYLPLLVSLTFYFMYRVCKGPGYVDKKIAELCKNTKNCFYCGKCEFRIPLRSAHCSSCNGCVLRRDHHCAWVGKCIGLKNHFHYVLFLICVMFVDGIYIFQNLNTPSKKGPLSEWIFTSMQSAIVVGFGCFSILSPLVLLPTHLIFVATNKTTWEVSRRDKISYLRNQGKYFNPWDKGLINNIKEFVMMANNPPVYELNDY